jgi:hypothetical protein
MSFDLKSLQKEKTGKSKQVSHKAKSKKSAQFPSDISGSLNYKTQEAKPQKVKSFPAVSSKYGATVSKKLSMA